MVRRCPVYPDMQEKLVAFSQDGVNPGGIDLVILTANPWPAHRLALPIAHPNGRVSIIALSGRGEPAPDFNSLPMDNLSRKRSLLSLFFSSQRD